jgi:hypothetical protein
LKSLKTEGSEGFAVNGHSGAFLGTYKIKIGPTMQTMQPQMKRLFVFNGLSPEGFETQTMQPFGFFVGWGVK